VSGKALLILEDELHCKNNKMQPCDELCLAEMGVVLAHLPTCFPTAALM